MNGTSQHDKKTMESAATLTVEEAALELRISRSLAYEAVRQGEIPSIRVGRRILVPRHAFSLMLERAGTGSSPLGDEAGVAEGGS